MAKRAKADGRRRTREAAPPGPHDPGGERTRGVPRAASKDPATATSAEAAPRASPPGSGGPGGAAPTRHSVRVDGEQLSIADLVAVAREGARAELAPEAVAAMEASRALVE